MPFIQIKQGNIWDFISEPEIDFYLRGTEVIKGKFGETVLIIGERVSDKSEVRLLALKGLAQILSFDIGTRVKIIYRGTDSWKGENGQRYFKHKFSIYKWIEDKK